MNNSRTSQSAKNAITGILNYVLNIILSFIVKTIFIYILGTELLGLNSLFSNILTILSLTELGFGPAIVFAMYKPMAEQDYPKVNALVKLYKKVYFIIGIIVSSIGLLLLPFIKYIINSDNTLNINIYIIYCLYLMNSVAGYFSAHRKALLYTSQRNDVENIITLISNIVSKTIQVISLFVFKNYYIFYIATMSATFIDIILSYIASSKIYKHLNICASTLSSEEKHYLFKNVTGMLCHKIGVAVVTGTDNILISIFINLTTLGIYSNYVFIISAISSCICLIINAMKASFGNAMVTKSKDEIENLQFVSLFIYCWLIVFCASSLYALLNHFIKMWLSTELTLSLLTVSMLILAFIIEKIRNPIQMVRDCAGLFSYVKWCPVCEAITNLIASIILVKCIGLPGVILGTIMGYVLFPLWIEPIVVYRHYYHKSPKIYWIKIITYFVVCCISCVLTYYICSLLPNIGLLYFILKCIICLLIPNFIMISLFFKTKEFKIVKQKVQDLLFSYFKKIFKHKNRTK